MDQVLQYWQTKLKAITPEPKEKIAFNKWHEILWAKVWWKWNPAQLIYIHVGIDLKGVFSRNANMELFLSMEIVALHGGNLEKYFIEFKTKIFTNTFLSDPGSIIVYACHSLTIWLKASIMTILKIVNMVTMIIIATMMTILAMMAILTLMRIAASISLNWKLEVIWPDARALPRRSLWFDQTVNHSLCQSLSYLCRYRAARAAKNYMITWKAKLWWECRKDPPRVGANQKPASHSKWTQVNLLAPNCSALKL